MALVAVKLPDVGEGVAEAELVEWHVEVGDVVREDDLLAAVMTDKATVEIPSPAAGKVAWLAGNIGDAIAVGSDLVRIETGETAAATPAEPAKAAEPEPVVAKPVTQPEAAAAPPPAAAKATRPVPAAGRVGVPRPEGERPLATPAVRLRAREAGIDLRQVPGSGPAGRITHEDLDAFLAPGVAPTPAMAPDKSVSEVKVTGLRRTIARRMALANERIPHITIVEEVDVSEIERLRARLNEERGEAAAKLTLLPLILRAIVRAVREQPEINAHYDDEAEMLTRHGGVHAGIATQTPGGLMVPVVRHAEALDLWQTAAEIARLAEAARSGKATREELAGSTITITSLGPLGAIATTPIINHPEVAIVGVNRIAVRPVWLDGAFVPRRMMNLSCSFDHRVIDGWNAARFVARLKTLIETPAMLFVEAGP